MKITYTPNPLSTIVELDEHEKKALWYEIKLEHYEDMIFGAHYTLTMNGVHGIPRPMDEVVAEACKELDPEYWCTDEKSKLDKRVDELLKHYLEELRGSHLGDCTAFPMSCSKCHAEGKLGIDTTKGLGKHAGYYIQSAFSRRDEAGNWLEERSLDEVLDRLAGQEVALTWLKNYRDEHFKP